MPAAAVVRDVTDRKHSKGRGGDLDNAEQGWTDLEAELKKLVVQLIALKNEVRSTARITKEP